MNRNLGVRQRQYAITSEQSRFNVLVTRNIFTCTAILGVDKNSGYSFLAHFDFPCSAKYLPQIIDEALVKSTNAKFEIHIFNGTFLGSFNAAWTRFFLKRHLKKYTFEKPVKDHGYLKIFLRRKIKWDFTKREPISESYFIHKGSEDGPISKCMFRSPLSL